jgi:hypothetical protein
MACRSSFRLCVLCSSLLVAGCGGPLSLLTGGGPNVAANVQAGAENRQALISQENAAPSVSIRPNSRTGDIRQEQNTNRVNADEVQTVVVNEASIWLILLAVAGWMVAVAGWADNVGRGIASLRRK